MNNNMVSGAIYYYVTFDFRTGQQQIIYRTATLKSTKWKMNWKSCNTECWPLVPILQTSPFDNGGLGSQQCQIKFSLRKEKIKFWVVAVIWYELYADTISVLLSTIDEILTISPETDSTGKYLSQFHLPLLLIRLVRTTKCTNFPSTSAQGGVRPRVCTQKTTDVVMLNISHESHAYRGWQQSHDLSPPENRETQAHFGNATAPTNRHPREDSCRASRGKSAFGFLFSPLDLAAIWQIPQPTYIYILIATHQLENAGVNFKYR